MVVPLSNSGRENSVGRSRLVTVINVKLINTKEEKVKPLLTSTSLCVLHPLPLPSQPQYVVSYNSVKYQIFFQSWITTASAVLERSSI